MFAHRSFRTVSRRSLLTGIGAGIAGAALGMPAAAAAEDTASAKLQRLRFATFNIHHGASPDDQLDLERIATVIKSMNVDVIGLQEVDRFWPRSDFVDQPQWLSRRLGMWKAYGANLILPPDDEAEEPGDLNREYGTLILSKWPIVHQRNIALPKFPEGEQRGLMRTSIATPLGLITFANTHLQHNNAEERQLQAETIVDMMGPRSRKTILVGDFNAEAGTAEIDTIDSLFDDAWAQAGDGPGYTYDTLDPSVRIDYVWSSPDLEVTAAQVVTDDPLASDHLPVVTEYRYGWRSA